MSLRRQRNFVGVLTILYSLILFTQLVAGDSDEDGQPGTEGDEKDPGAFIQHLEKNFEEAIQKSDKSGNILSKDPNDMRFYLYSDPENADNKTDIIYKKDKAPEKDKKKKKKKKDGSEESTDAPPSGEDSNEEENLASFNQSGYDVNKKLILLIHGFEATAFAAFPQLVKDAFLNNSDVLNSSNIVIVGWGKLSKAAKPQDRPKAAGLAAPQAKIVGKRIASFLQFLKNKASAIPTYEDVHMIGFGLGAQIGGVAAKVLKKEDGEKTGRLTGLDASTNFFTLLGGKELSIADVKKSVIFVDGIHTDCGRMGIGEPYGHVDFFPNGGGPYQPGCFDGKGKKKEKHENGGEDPEKDSHAGIPSIFSGICPHNKAVDYFTMSISSTDYFACRCDVIWDDKCMKSCPKQVTFGYSVPTTARGKYMLKIKTDDVTDDSEAKFQEMGKKSEDDNGGGDEEEGEEER